MKRRPWLIGGVGVAAAAAGIGWSLRPSRSGLDAAETALWGMSFEQPGGGTLALAALRGHPLLLNFWATWCAPCIKEMPMLDRFHREQQASGWRVVGLAVDAPTPVREYLQKLPMGFPIGLAGMEGAHLSRTLGNTGGGLPFTVVLDRDGRVHERKLGSLEPRDLARWAQELSARA